MYLQGHAVLPVAKQPGFAVRQADFQQAIADPGEECQDGLRVARESFGATQGKGMVYGRIHFVDS